MRYHVVNRLSVFFRRKEKIQLRGGHFVLGILVMNFYSPVQLCLFNSAVKFKLKGLQQPRFV